jgi:hypothetical protein
MKLGILLLAGLLAACTPAVAQSPTATPAPSPGLTPAPTPRPAPAPPARPITIAGFGSVTCRTWVSEPQNGPEHIAHQQWLLGFVSGYNAFIADGASIPPDSAGTIGWVDHYGCPHGPDLPLQNGDLTIAQVGIALVEFTRQRTNYPRLWPPRPPVQYVP